MAGYRHGAILHEEAGATEWLASLEETLPGGGDLGTLLAYSPKLRFIADRGRGDKLATGATLRGPAIIEEETTTIFVPEGDLLRRDPAGFYLLSINAA